MATQKDESFLETSQTWYDKTIRFLNQRYM